MKARSLAALSGLVALTYGAPSYAGDTTDIQSILSEPVISTASATDQRASAAPALSTTITADDIRTFGLRSLAEAINFLSLGVITADPLRTPDIGSRGVLFENDNGKHFLLLLNGHAINDPLYGAARFDQGAGIPLDLVDRIEVVVGPGSVLYGSNAMMGVINVITKAAPDYAGGHVLADYEVGRSYRGSAGAGTSFTLFGAPSELTAGVEYYGRYGPSLSFDRTPYNIFPPGPFAHISYGENLPINTWGGRLNNAYYVEAPSAMVRLRSGDFELNVFANAYKRGIPYSSPFANVQFDDAQSSELDRSLRVDIKHQAALSTLLQLTSRAYADSFDYQRHLDVDGATGCLNANIAVCQYYDAGVARWAGAEERLALNWRHDQNVVTTVGVDGRVRWVGTKEDMLDTSTNRLIAPTTGRLDNTGGIVSPYLQQTFSPAWWIDVNAGARLDVDSRFSPVVSPRGAVALRPLEKTTLKVSYSQAFRAPTLSETSIVDYQVAPSPNLQPETVRSVEASVEQRFATQRLLFGVFRTWWQNLVESGPVSTADLSALQAQHLEPLFVGNLIQYNNVANIDNFGWNGAWEGSLLERRLRFGANATGAFTRLVQHGESSPPSVAPQIFGNVHVAYALGAGLPVPALTVYGMGPRPADRTAPSGALLPAASAMADVRLAVTGHVPKVRGLGYSVTVDYATASRGPYTAGPAFSTYQNVLLVGGNQIPPPGFAPIDQLRVMVGLRFDFSGGPQSPGPGEVP